MNPFGLEREKERTSPGAVASTEPVALGGLGQRRRHAAGVPPMIAAGAVAHDDRAEA